MSHAGPAQENFPLIAGAIIGTKGDGFSLSVCLNYSFCPPLGAFCLFLTPRRESSPLEASLRRGSGIGVTRREVDVSSFNAISGAFYNSLEYLSIAQTISPSTRLHALAGSAVTFRRWRVGLCLRRFTKRSMGEVR